MCSSNYGEIGKIWVVKNRSRLCLKEPKYFPSAISLFVVLQQFLCIFPANMLNKHRQYTDSDIVCLQICLRRFLCTKTVLICLENNSQQETIRLDANLIQVCWRTFDITSGLFWNILSIQTQTNYAFCYVSYGDKYKWILINLSIFIHLFIQLYLIFQNYLICRHKNV